MIAELGIKKFKVAHTVMTAIELKIGTLNDSIESLAWSAIHCMLINSESEDIPEEKIVIAVCQIIEIARNVKYGAA